MLNLSVPALIKIREGITVNLSLSVSQSFDKDMPQYAVKPAVKKLVDSGEIGRQLVQDDYEEIGKSSTATFWFIDGKSLTYRVGEEITQDDYERIVADLDSLNYKLKK